MAIKFRRNFSMRITRGILQGWCRLYIILAGLVDVVAEYKQTLVDCNGPSFVTARGLNGIIAISSASDD